MLDQIRESSNCLGIIFTEKFDKIKMKEYLKNKLIQSTFFRVKSIPEFKYGYWWFKKMSDETFKIVADKIIKFEDSVKDNKSLLMYLQKE